ncbi:SRPBCC domain-containing protein [Amycolatopsis sp. NPDC021455]|uniref:SRPBCC family protein n=1 Tax=Amycolatopsis sp. NPDC021455 TaxID=3154901 RepID=UPI00340648AC
MTTVDKTAVPDELLVPLDEPSPFPPLRPSARPVAQDRWERLITTVLIPACVDAVWEALTTSERVGRWLAATGPSWACPGEASILDFRDGEFFRCQTDVVEPPGDDDRSARLGYRWRWVGVGPATRVTWQLAELGDSTSVTVTEIGVNGPADWRSWNGMGWPGILDQLADHIATDRDVRWTWRRMGPYVQAELPVPPFEAWAALTAVPALQFWLGRTAGSLASGDRMPFVLGDASGTAALTVTEHVEAGQRFPSYLPSVSFTLERLGWPGQLSGYLWIEPAQLGGSLLQVFHTGWEIFGSREAAPHDRTLLTQFWVGAFGRLEHLLTGGRPPEPSGRPSSGPHSWSA